MPTPAAPQYSPAGHPLLTTAASALEPHVLAAQAVVAERALGLRDTQLSGTAAAEAAGFVALQVSLQVRIGPKGDVVSESKGSQSYTYAQVDGQRVPVDPLAQAGVRRLLGTVSHASAAVPASIVW